MKFSLFFYWWRFAFYGMLMLDKMLNKKKEKDTSEYGESTGKSTFPLRTANATESPFS